jgi:hypothetical protein
LSQPSNSDQLIVVEEIKMNLMSKSCFAPGIINFISNLISSTANEDKEYDEKWINEYVEGMGHEIYRIKLSSKMENKTFAEVASIVYKHNKTIVFGIEIETNGKTIIRLNPNEFKISNIEDNQIHVYVISEDGSFADEVETLEMDKEEKVQYWNKRAQEEKKTMDEDGNNSDMDDRDIADISAAQHVAADIDVQYENDNADKKMMDQYYVSEDRMDLMNVTLASLENSNVKNHIVVCGIHSAIKNFIMPLRMKYLKEYQLQKIVIITGEPDERGGEQIDSQIWNSISRFK